MIRSTFLYVRQFLYKIKCRLVIHDTVALYTVTRGAVDNTLAFGYTGRGFETCERQYSIAKNKHHRPVI